MSNNPYYYEEIIRHRYEEMQRNELRAQLAAHARAEQDHSSPVARGRELIARIPGLRSVRSPREAYS